MRRKPESRMRSNNDQGLQKIKNEIESTTSTHGKKKIMNSKHTELSDLKFCSKGKSTKESKSEIQKVTRNIEETTSNGLSDGKNENALITKEVQIILKQCDVPQKHIKNFKLHSGNLKSSYDSKLSVDNISEKVKSIPNQRAGKGKKRKRERSNEGKSEDDVKPTKSAKKQKETDKSKSAKDQIPDVTSIDFTNVSKSPDGNLWNFKISSWNVNGIRAWLEKNGFSYFGHEKPDIMCIQETKCSDDKLPEEMKKIEGYHAYWLSGDKDGYSGVGLISKQEPIKVEYGIGISEHDNEGRVITAEYEKFYLVAAYVPNAGRGLVRLEYRMKWDKDFRDYLKKLDVEKPVILCGDLNVAHSEIDLANPKTNKKNAGFTKEEREGFSALLKEGFIDTFRYFYPDAKGAYTFWTYMMNARAKNVGWRLDYFVTSERFCKNLCDSIIRKDVFGSDHCPVTLFLSI